MCEIKVSIIVPVYNAQDYIDKCVKSILRQSYRNIEIILVDDGSTDFTTKICDSYVRKDSRVITIHRENEGVSQARNTGIETASGDYILFVDGDDWLDADYVRQAVDRIKMFEGKIDVLFTPYIREYKNKSIENNLFSKDEIFFSAKKVKKLLRKFIGPYRKEMRKAIRIDDLSPVWGKFYKTEFCKGVKFVDLSLIGAEDVWYNINIFSKVSNAYYYGAIYYHYNKENHNSFISSYKKDLFYKWKNKYKYMEEFLRKNRFEEEYKEALNNRIVIDLFALIRNIVRANLTWSQKRKEILTILDDSLYQRAFAHFSYKYLEMKWKFFYRACEYRILFLIFLMMFLAEQLKKQLK